MKEKNKGITADQFCYRTDILSRTYVEQVGKKEYKFNIAQPEQNNSFLKNYLNLPIKQKVFQSTSKNYFS